MPSGRKILPDGRGMLVDGEMLDIQMGIVQVRVLILWMCMYNLCLTRLKCVRKVCKVLKH